MQRIHQVLMHLQPVAVVRQGIRPVLNIGQVEGVVVGEGGHLLGMPQVGKDQTVPLDRWVGALPHLAQQWTVGRLGRRVQELAVDAVVPAVVAADDAAIRDAAELQRGAAVAAVQVQQGTLAGFGAQRHQLLAEDAHLDRQVLQLRRQAHRLPVAPHRLAHGRARPGVGQQAVFGWNLALQVALEAAFRCLHAHGVASYRPR